MIVRIVPKMRLVSLLLLIVSSCAFCTKEVKEEEPTPAEETAETKSRFAMLDDVRLLATGLLQLGQSLKEFVHKTKGQINDIFQKLNIFDRSFNQLSVVTSEIKEGEEELKKTTSYLKTNNEEIKNLSMEIYSKINNVIRERDELQSKVWGLEERLRGLSQSVHNTDQLTEISVLKDVITAQERSITDLLTAVKEQHEQLNFQKTKIKSLEDKLNLDAFQDTAEQKPAFNPDASKLFEYLTNNSTNTTFGTNGGASMVIQRRQDGSVDFDQIWEKYENGFGDLEGDFWLGLKKIYSVASQSDTVLQIELEDWKGEKRSVEYQFSLEGPASHYTLHLTHLSGNLHNAMANHTGMKFSTRDSDNDNNKDINCAQTYTGGWWFNACGDTNLNGNYIWVKPRGRTERRRGLYWKSERGNSYSLKSTQISIQHAPDVSGFP
ncbi:hypothetical protein JZ751_024912 [Albula glossodonta]|uniref:Fibrinogen C-terminal domain-containing protein n=1 Tax=Albula glossodonta TaxID=121402 RepID=A0A8T2PCB4_9TELE|nr:hypothetical protein JZ751_024912 [Albula glossodonta]